MTENKDKNINEKKKEPITGAKRAVPIILSAVAVFLTVCYLTREAGFLGAALSSFMTGRDANRGDCVHPSFLPTT